MSQRRVSVCAVAEEWLLRTSHCSPCRMSARPKSATSRRSTAWHAASSTPSATALNCTAPKPSGAQLQLSPLRKQTPSRKSSAGLWPLPDFQSPEGSPEPELMGVVLRSPWRGGSIGRGLMLWCTAAAPSHSTPPSRRCQRRAPCPEPLLCPNRRFVLNSLLWTTNRQQSTVENSDDCERAVLQAEISLELCWTHRRG